MRRWTDEELTGSYGVQRLIVCACASGRVCPADLEREQVV